MEDTLVNMDMGLSQVLKDTFTVFVNAYHNYIDLIVSCMFSNIGAYDIIPQLTRLETFVKYSEQFSVLQNSYIWSNMHELSAMLKNSFLYRVTSDSSHRMSYFNDDVLSVTIIKFKEAIINFINDNGTFLAYCDIESCALFMYTNGNQSITKDVFESQFVKARSDLMNIHKIFKGRLPKVFYGVLDDFQSILDVRAINDEKLVVPTSIANWPNFQKFQKEEFAHAIREIPSCGLKDLYSHLQVVYTNSVPIFTLSMFHWLIIIQGIKTDEMPSIQETFDIEALVQLQNFKERLQGETVPFMKREFSGLPFLLNVLEIIEDNDFFQKHTYLFLGEFALCMIKKINRIYCRNVNTLVLADILNVGFYDVIAKDKQVPLEEVNLLLLKSTTDVEGTLACFQNNMYMYDIVKRSLFVLEEAIKKLKRYQRWLSHINDDDVNDDSSLHAKIDILFGNVFDDDGHPKICSICLDSSEERKDTWFPLPCSHMYHIQCVNQMLCRNITSCPLCRKEI
jgi:hypothetical protein